MGTFGEIGDAWEELRVFSEAFRDLGERAIAVIRLEGRAIGGDARVAARHAVMFDLSQRQDLLYPHPSR